MTERVEVRRAGPGELAEPLALLAEALRDGKPIPHAFAERLEGAVQGRDLEFLVARYDRCLFGVAVLAFRPGVAVGADFASVEELHVKPRARRRGVGRALLQAVEERCRERGVSYVEVQTDDEAAAFYEACGYELESGVRVLSCSHAAT